VRKKRLIFVHKYECFVSEVLILIVISCGVF